MPRWAILGKCSLVQGLIFDTQEPLTITGPNIDRQPTPNGPFVPSELQGRYNFTCQLKGNSYQTDVESL